MGLYFTADILICHSRKKIPQLLITLTKAPVSHVRESSLIILFISVCHVKMSSMKKDLWGTREKSMNVCILFLCICLFFIWTFVVHVFSPQGGKLWIQCPYSTTWNSIFYHNKVTTNTWVILWSGRAVQCWASRTSWFSYTVDSSCDVYSLPHTHVLTSFPITVCT